MSDKTTRMGTVMLWLAWCCLLMLLMLFFKQFTDEPSGGIVESTLDRNGVRTVTLEVHRGSVYIAQGRINDVSVTFLVDTGASTVAVPGNLADKLKLRRGPAIRAITAKGTAVAYMTWIKKIQIGHIVLRNVRGNIVPEMPGQRALLGMSALKQLDFSQENNKFILRQR